MSPASNNPKVSVDKEKSIKTNPSATNAKVPVTAAPNEYRDQQKSKGSTGNDANNSVNKTNVVPQTTNTKLINCQTVSEPQQINDGISQSTTPTSIKSNENQSIDTNQSSNPNDVITNGHSSNGNNRRVPKPKWVPLDIELPKARGKPRERNNNTTQRTTTEISTRSQTAGSNSSEYNDRERSSRRYAGTRSSNNGRSSNTNGSTHPSTKPIPNSVRPNTNSNPSARPMNPAAVNTRRSGPIRSIGGSSKLTRPNRISSHHHNQNG